MNDKTKKYLLSTAICIAIVHQAILAGCYSSGSGSEAYEQKAAVSIKHIEVDKNEVEKEEVLSCKESTKNFSDEDLNLLAHLIMAESGSDWCEDEMLYMVGSVALNRIDSDLFPDSLYEVIYEEGQYSSATNGGLEKDPTDRCYRIAEELLTNGSILPKNVVFQAEFIQGTEIYKKVQNMYFCSY